MNLNFTLRNLINFLVTVVTRKYLFSELSFYVEEDFKEILFLMYKNGEI